MDVNKQENRNVMENVEQRLFGTGAARYEHSDSKERHKRLLWLFLSDIFIFVAPILHVHVATYADFTPLQCLLRRRALFMHVIYS